MKIILNVDRNMASGWKKAGELVELADNLALRWINAGITRYADTGEMVINRPSEPIEKYNLHDKVSIVILVKDALKYFKLCLESVVKYTFNYKLIIVDNDSDSQTKKYLSEQQVKYGFTLITNKENKGYSYGNNQAIKLATCGYICFLNSDCTVTRGWLSRLMEGFNQPNVGIVGPSTCWANSNQMIRALSSRHNNMTLDEINTVKLDSGIVETELMGFCYLVSKKVIDKIGVFDWKRYGLGLSEEKDYNWRAKKAGFRLYWIKDVYVHHWGNKTWKEIGINPYGLLLKNEQILADRIKNDSNIFIENNAVIKKKFIGKRKNTIPIRKELIPILLNTYNRLPYTKRVLSNLLANIEDCPNEIFIFDNNSTDGTREYLESVKDERIILHLNEKNEGIIKPKNIFIERYKNNEYCAFIDNDNVMPKGWLKTLKDVMDNYPLIAVQLEHYVGLGWDFKENMDWFKHMYHIDFNGHNLYLNNCNGGCGAFVRRTYITGQIPEMRGTLSGWVSYLMERFNKDNLVSGFYDGLFMELCDMKGTNQKIYDFPDYKKELSTLGRIDFGSIKFTKKDEENYKKIRNKIEGIVKGWNICE